jgi:hypothetical protein
MEILFENTHVRTEDFVKEIFQYVLFKRKPLIVSGLLFLLTLILNAYVGNWMLIIILCIFLALFFAFAYSKNVKLTIRRDEEISPNPITVNTVVTDGYIQPAFSVGSVYKIYFRDIKQAAQTKNYILLTTKAMQILAFRKAGFSKGTPEEFIAFLRTKGYKL